MSLGKLYVVSGPSGVGKSTICKIVREKLKINLSISATSRAPREGEKDGVDYYFISKEEFEKKIKNNEFVEYALVHGNYYGTLKTEVEKRLLGGEKIILEIDVQGGLQVKELYKDSVLIFFKTASIDIMEQRLRNRKTESEKDIDTRLKNSMKELEYEKLYDAIIINDTIDQATNELINIIEKED